MVAWDGGGGGGVGGWGGADRDERGLQMGETTLGLMGVFLF